MWRRSSLLGLVVVAVASSVSCAPVSNSAVLGKWRTPTGGTIEFKRDGTAIMAGPLGSRDVRYQMLDAQTVELSKSEGGGTAIRWEIVSASKDALVVKSFDGVETRLTRGD